MDVDGVRLKVRIPKFDMSSVEGGLLRALRPMWFEHLADSDPVLVGLVPSSFQRAWLAQVFISGLANRAAHDRAGLGDALDSLGNAQLLGTLVTAAQEIFGSLAPQPGQQMQAEPLLGDIIRDVSNQQVLQWLRDNGRVLWEPHELLGWTEWLDRRFLSTIGAAVIEASQLLCPENDASELRLETDILVTGTTHRGEILILEDEPGGSGMIETFVDRYIDDPRSFWGLVAASLQQGDQERVDSCLRDFLSILNSDPVIRSDADTIRSSTNLRDLTDGWGRLRSSMFTLGLDTDPSVIAGVATRILRPGSNYESERLLSDVLLLWDEVEEHLGIELELRVVAYIASQDPSIVRRLSLVVGAIGQAPDWAYTQIVGLLWNRGARLRAAALQCYNPFTKLPTTERLLASGLANPVVRTVRLPAVDWRAQVDQVLNRDGYVKLQATDYQDLADALAKVVAEPTYLDSLEVQPRIAGLLRSSSGLEALVELREMIQ